MPRVKAKRPEGRPTSYRPEYCEQIVEFFSVKPYFQREVITTGKNDYQKVETVDVPNDLPHLVDFCLKINVNPATISDWAKRYPEFDDALKTAKLINEKMLAINALRGLYNSTFSIFMAKNKFGWRDEQYLKGENMAPIINIVRADANQVKELSGQLCFQRSPLSGSSISLGDGKESLPNS